MTVSRADEARIRTLLSYLFNASIEIKVRQILKDNAVLGGERPSAGSRRKRRCDVTWRVSKK
jgi:hypothetical protein